MLSNNSKNLCKKNFSTSNKLLERMWSKQYWQDLYFIVDNILMRYYTKVCYSFSEKIMLFLMKQIFTTVGTNKFEGTYENVKKVIDISVKSEINIQSELRRNALHLLNLKTK